MSDEARATRRWLYTWIAIGTVVVIVVIVFLIAISNSLRTIDRGLDETTKPVAGVRSDVDPLSTDVASVNASLARIRDELRPLSGQARQVIGNLDSIDMSLRSGEGMLSHTAGTLEDTNGALTDTSHRLDSTAGRLVTTSDALTTTQSRLATVAGTLLTLSGTLTQTLSLASAIEHTLVLAQTPSSQGTEAIWRHVQVLNGGRFTRHTRPNRRGLPAIDVTGHQITDALTQVNGHLQSICESVPLRSLGQLEGGNVPVPVSDPSAPARC